jgi:hypothetical protein
VCRACACAGRPPPWPRTTSRSCPPRPQPRPHPGGGTRHQSCIPQRLSHTHCDVLGARTGSLSRCLSQSVALLLHPHMCSVGGAAQTGPTCLPTDQSPLCVCVCVWQVAGRGLPRPRRRCGRSTTPGPHLRPGADQGERLRVVATKVIPMPRKPVGKCTRLPAGCETADWRHRSSNKSPFPALWQALGSTPQPPRPAEPPRPPPAPAATARWYGGRHRFLCRTPHTESYCVMRG